LNDCLTSTSWRMTAPARAAARAVKRVWSGRS
jgi:hypothetical protein